ncbi:MAG: ribose 5-phosphate isomerase B [Phycisphaeraceae bacterium]|nr:ribose 5-phosphate isomerase B [Phycisphaeraceae bacterium]
MKIVIGADHRGTDVARTIAEALQAAGHSVEPLGVAEAKTCDYPDRAYPVAKAVADGKAEAGILFCGTGIGMSIAANKVDGVRAALVHDEVGARMAKRHNNANVLCLSADMLGLRVIEQIIFAWLNTHFEGGRHARRIAKINAIEQGKEPSSVPSGDIEG